MIQQIRRLGTNTLTYGLGDAFTRLIGFALLPVFTAYLTPNDYGIISIVGVVVFIVTPIFSIGLASAMGAVYFTSAELRSRAAVVWTAFGVLLVSASALAVVAFALPGPISQLAFRTDTYADIVTLALLSTGLGVLGTPFTLYLQFEQRARSFVFRSMFITIVRIVLDVLVIVVLQTGVRGMMTADVAIQALRLLVFILPALRAIGPRFNRSIGFELLRLGLPLTPGFAFLFVIQQSNKNFLERFHGLDVTGIYTVGLNLGATANLLVSAFVTAWTPYFMSFVDKQEEARTLFGRLLTYYVFGFGSLCILYLIAARPGVMIMTQPRFHDAYRVIGLTATAYVLVGVFSLLLPAVYFAKEVKYVSVVQAGAAAISIALNLTLIPMWGALGTALAFMLGTLSMAVCQHLWNRHRCSYYLNVRYEWGRIGKFTLVYVVYAVLMLWDRDLSLAGEIAISIGAALSLPLVLFALLTENERRRLWSVPGMFRNLLAARRRPDPTPADSVAALHPIGSDRDNQT